MILTQNLHRVKVDFELTFVADVTMPSWFAGAASSFGVIFVSIKTTYLIAFKVLQEKGKKDILIRFTFLLESLQDWISKFHIQVKDTL